MVKSRKKMQSVVVIRALASVICILAMGTWCYGATFDVGVEADAHVLSYRGTDNFGAEEVMKIQLGSNPTGLQAYKYFKSYMAFDISDLNITTLESATLKFYVRDVSDYIGTQLHGIVDNDDWDLTAMPETAISWNNAPKNSLMDYNFTAGSVLLWDGWMAPVPYGNYPIAGEIGEVDVTDYIKWAAGLNPGYGGGAASDTDGMVTLMFGSWYPYLGLATLDTKESTAVDAYPARLTLDFNGGDPPTLLEGDANRDGFVSAGDYASVQSNFGDTGAAGIDGDANGDGVVSAGDYASVQANFGNVAAAQVTPEPATMSLLALGGLAVLRRRRR